MNCLRGQVLLRVECAFPERVLNLCGAHELAFWDLNWESAAVFSCRMSRGDWHRLRLAARKLDCSLEVLGREGTPYFLNRFRHRQALLMGLVVCGLTLFLGSFFVWEYEIQGNLTVPDEKILRALEKNGVRRGAFGLSLNGENIRNHVLLDLPELSWIAVNVSGCKAHVEVRERIPAPELLDKRTPSNVVARRPGLVLEQRVLQGGTCVLPGMVVERGQLLISGVQDTDTVGASILAGLGSVTARTWYTLTAPTPLHREAKRFTGREFHGISLIVGTKRVKFFSNSSMEGANYDKIARRHPWSLFGIPLPVTLVTETCRFYERVPAERSAAEAERQLERVLTDQLRSITAPYGTVESTLVTSRLRGEQLWVTLRAECREEIGESDPL